jgi:hypothetical protein
VIEDVAVNNVFSDVAFELGEHNDVVSRLHRYRVTPGELEAAILRICPACKAEF